MRPHRTPSPTSIRALDRDEKVIDGVFSLLGRSLTAGVVGRTARAISCVHRCACVDRAGYANHVMCEAKGKRT